MVLDGCLMNARATRRFGGLRLLTDRAGTR